MKNTFKNQLIKKNSIWFMRQAGRYLPEYMEIRSKQKDFLTMCYDSNVATELTMQPILRFDFDIAIIFSDILVLLDEIGFNVKFVSGFGPIIENSLSIFSIDENSILSENKLKNVYLAIKKTRIVLDQEKPLFGFIGAPWTLACYLCTGKSSKDFHETKKFAYNKKEEFSYLMKILIKACSIHAMRQIEAGADAIQIFDSWANILDDYDYQKWVLEPLTEICASIKAKYPGTPIIWFPRASFPNYAYFLGQNKKHLSGIVDCLGIDYSTNLDLVCELVDDDLMLQGNLDPAVLLSEDEEFVKNKTIKILNTFKKYRKKFIFNLGHGVLPETKISNVELVIECVRNFENFQ